MTQPPWVYQVWPQFDNETTIGIISNLKKIRRISEFNSPEKARLRGGLLLKDWLDRAKNVSLGLSITPRKIKLHSAVCSVLVKFYFFNLIIVLLKFTINFPAISIGQYFSLHSITTWKKLIGDE